ncbi:MAG TPA: tetratricopeptide repeat protein [Thermoanaerobaculia bacterium]|nr:tetratricopeptide repeat protein [Thermoanaerobaculia bacterium]
MVGEVNLYPPAMPPPVKPEFPIFGFPYPSLGPLFEGRDQVLLQLRDSLSSISGGKASAATAKAIHGLGGVGKTRLVVEYAWKFAPKYTALLFVGASSAAHLRQNLAGMGEGLGLPVRDLEDEARTTAVVRWLRENPGWLLILDNVDDDSAMQAADELIANLPAGHVLLTGRNGRWGTGIEALELGLLSEESALTFLLARTKDTRRSTKEDEKDALEIARDQGYLPLALEQAGAYVAEHRLTLAEYRQEWQQRREAVLAWFDPFASRYPVSIAVTWQTSVDRLSSPTLCLLDRLAWLGTEPIPETLLDVAVPDLDKPEAGPAARASLAELDRYSLATRAADAPTFTVHRLVQEVTRRRQERNAEKGALRRAALWVDAAFEGDPSDVRSWPVLEPLTPHARTVVRFADEAGIAQPTAHLMDQLGILLQTKALAGEAEPLLRRSLALNRASFGEAHAVVATSLNNLAQLLKDTNRSAEAEPLMRLALTIDDLKLGAEHANVARDLNNLARLLQDTNRLAEAEPLMRRALAIDEAIFGAEKPEVAIDLNNLAQLLQAENCLREAEILMERTVRIFEVSLGENHPNVAVALNNLAQILQETNRLEEAEPLMRRALAIDEECFGQDHPKVAIRLNNLARLFQDTNRNADAEPPMLRGLSILLVFERRTGFVHPEKQTLLENTRDLLTELGRSESEIEATIAKLGMGKAS